MDILERSAPSNYKVIPFYPLHSFIPCSVLSWSHSFDRDISLVSIEPSSLIRVICRVRSLKDWCISYLDHSISYHSGIGENVSTIHEDMTALPSSIYPSFPNASLHVCAHGIVGIPLALLLALLVLVIGSGIWYLPFGKRILLSPSSQCCDQWWICCLSMFAC